MPNKDTFHIHPEAPKAKPAEIVRLDKEAAAAVLTLQVHCIEKGIIISNTKLVSDMIRFCVERVDPSIFPELLGAEQSKEIWP